MTSIVLFRNNKSKNGAFAKRPRIVGANDNIMVKDFEPGAIHRNWCIISVFTSIFFVGFTVMATPFL